MQANRCPQEFQDRLTLVGGTNPQGEPIFRIVWGSYSFRRAGGYWEGWGTGYRDLPESSDCWLLQMWEPAEVYGYPAAYYWDNTDDATRLQQCGEYPYHGRYMTIQSFSHKEVINGRLVIMRMPLNSQIIDITVPIIMDAKHHTMAKRKIAIDQIKERKRKDGVNQIADALRAGTPAFGGEAVSFRGQGCKTSLLSKKMHEIEKSWARAMKVEAYRRRGMGIQQH